MKREGSELREIGLFLKRFPSIISNKIARDFRGESDYVAALAGEQAYFLRVKNRMSLIRTVGDRLFEAVKDHLKKKWSPEQTAGTVKIMHSDQPSHRVSH